MLLFAEAFPNVVKPLTSIKYFLTILLIFFFHFWFGNNFYGEYFIAIVIVLGNLKMKYFSSVYKVKQEYLDATQSLNITNNKKTNIVWKSVQPDLFVSIQFSHYTLWSLLIIYEYINGTEGIGSILRLAIKYNDFSIVVLLIIIIAISLWLSTLLLDLIKDKFFFWEELESGISNQKFRSV
jgi:ABC-type nitrate/sulfonate/bicarbonate transport system permease component